MKPLLNKQKGHAAILFSMLIPLFMGVFNLGTEGARALQNKARMNDALEVAALAISAHDDPNLVSGGMPANYGSQVNRKIASDFISAYFAKEGITGPNDLKNLTIERNSCLDIGLCTHADRLFYQYEVNAVLAYDTWFTGNSVVVGFGDKVDVGSNSISRRFDTEPLDVVLVADFSNSMTTEWDGGYKKKYQDLIDIIVEVADRLNRYNTDLSGTHRFSMGIAPFDHYAHRKADTSMCPPEAQSSNGNANVEHVVFNPDESIDFIATFQNALHQDYSLDSICTPNIEGYNSYNFFNLHLTSDISPASTFLTSVKGFSPGSNSKTASYSGIIDGYKLLKEGTQKKRMLIVLSDGLDLVRTGPSINLGPQRVPESDPYSSFSDIAHELMVRGGLCQTMKTEMSKQIVNGEPAELKLYLIGFDYQVGTTNTALDACVGGPQNTFYAQNKDEIIDQLFSILKEEIGHLK